jgi:hypothetical protein
VEPDEAAPQDGQGAEPQSPQTDAAQTKQCPFCGETILAVARKCKHCGEFLDDQVGSGERGGQGGSEAPASGAPARKALSAKAFLSPNLLVSVLVLAAGGWLFLQVADSNNYAFPGVREADGSFSARESKVRDGLVCVGNTRRWDLLIAVVLVAGAVLTFLRQWVWALVFALVAIPIPLWRNMISGAVLIWPWVFVCLAVLLAISSFSCWRASRQTAQDERTARGW